MTCDAVIVRPARSDELSLLPEIERAAAARFARIGLHEIANEEATSEEELADAQRAGLLLVATEAGDAPAGFALLALVDDALHLDELSVHPAHGGRGLGARLLDATESLAAARGIAAITLVTFRDVPWNAPWYRRNGFVELPLPTLQPGLSERWKQEATRGLDPARRLCMARRVRRPAG
jgi:ribosomal protein S18 acetylase RimI-like enzyme